MAACGISTTLRIGASGDAVRCLQTTLDAAGFDSGPVDGAFGPVTYRATVAFQRARGLVVDGIVGPQTGGALGIWGGSGRARAGGGRLPGGEGAVRIMWDLGDVADRVPAVRPCAACRPRSAPPGSTPGPSTAPSER